MARLPLAWPLFCTLATAWIGGAVGCHPTYQEAEELRIGWLGILSAPPGLKATDRDLLDGALLRIEESVANGGLVLGGRRLRPALVVEDTGSSPQEAVAMARRLISQQGVLALVGPSRSRDAIAVADVAENLGVPMVSPASSHPRTTAGRHWVFRTAFTDPIQAEALAYFARKELGQSTCAILFDVADQYSSSLAAHFRTHFEHLDGIIVASESYTTGESSWDEQLARIQAAAPGILFLPSYTAPSLGQLAALKRLEIDAIRLGPDAWITDQMEAEPVAQGAYFSQHWHPNLATSHSDKSNFRDRFTARFKRPPTSGAALSWDAIGLILDALRRADRVEPQALRDALADTIDYPGLTGTFSLQGQGGDPRKPVHLLRFIDGRTVLHRSLAPQPAKTSQQ